MNAITLIPLCLPLVLSLPGELETPETGSADTWPQWRGPSRDGHSEGTTWADGLGEEKLVQTWQVPDLGPSYSGPVVDAKRVYTTEAEDEKYEVVRAFDRDSGKEVWATRWEGSMEVPFFAARNGSWIRSTPALDENSIYVAGMRDVLKCIDVASGEVRWTVDFTERYETPLPPFGFVSSPLLDDDHVYVQAGASLVKLEKDTGKSVWRSMVEGGDMQSSGAFSSPVFGSIGGVHQLVVQSRTTLAGVSVDDGSLLWSTPVKAFRGMNILTPTVYGDGVFTSVYGGRTHLFQVDSSDGGQEVSESWNVPMQGYMTSPVIVDRHAFLFLKSNRFACVNLETGEKSWTSPPTGDAYWSIVSQGDRILALSDAGMLRLVKASADDYEVISERQIVEDETWAPIVPVGNQLFVRAQGSLIAMEWK